MPPASKKQASSYKPDPPKAHQWKRGQSGNPHGRRLIDPKTAEERRRLAEEAGMTPLEFLMSVMVDQELGWGNRIDAAKTAAPYYHRKMPVAIEVEKPVAALDVIEIAKLNKSDRTKLLDILQKMGLKI